MFRTLKLKLISKLLWRKDISTLLISLGITKEEYNSRYNDHKHVGYRSETLISSIKDIERLEKDFAFILGIKKYPY